jgi:hypothetical protein
MSNYTSEILPSGLKFEGDGENFTLSFGTNKLFISKRDVSRMDGIAHPAKVHGKWKGHCGEGLAETQREKDNRILLENGIDPNEFKNINYSPDIL